MRIALVGFGGVGKAFLRLLADKREELLKEGLDIQVNYVINSIGGVYQPKGISIDDFYRFLETEKDLTKYPHGGSKEISFKKVIENMDVDMVVEMTPTNKVTGEPGLTHIRKSLENGIHVVTANKGPILLKHKELNELAVQNKVQLGVGCTTGGALPSVNGGLLDMAGTNVYSIEGILNGTTNFILKEMEEKEISYQQALQHAQEMGIAETNPAMDVEGWDTAIKLLILTNVLMKEEKTLEDISVDGISHLTIEDIRKAKKDGKRYKLIGRSLKKEGQLEITVQCELVSQDHMLYGISGENKAVRYCSDTLGDLTLSGGASGLIPTAASLLRDIVNIHRGVKFSRM